jgi:DNA-directed RNA polymerase subunit F
MTKPKILNEEPMSMVDVKQKLAEIKKKDKELNFRANKTEEYMSQFVEISPKQEEEIKAKLNKLKIPRLKDMHIIKILDTLPSSPQQLKAILQGYTITLTAENMKKITDVTKEYLPEEK